MPIQNVAIMHNFGIISHSQRISLQEHLLRQSYIDSSIAAKSTNRSRGPLEVNEEFTNQYNSSRNIEEREKYEDQADKLLERVKRRAGLKDGGVGPHVNIPMAWTELAQLAQCKGRIQEACLDALITSLDQAPLSVSNITTLFFLAETTLYWLRTDVIQHPYMRLAELKLLKMGYFVFLRLYFHHMAGHLQSKKEFKKRLFVYLEGLHDYQDAYSTYPNALLCLRFINEVGKIILSDLAETPRAATDTSDPITDAKTAAENQNAVSTSQDVTSQDGERKTDSSIGKLKKTGMPQATAAQNYASGNKYVYSINDSLEGASRGASATLSACVHDLSPSLWHSLDVWRCTSHLGGGKPAALKSLLQCGVGISSENWVDTICAIYILSEAAKNDLSAIIALQDLARGVMPPPPSPLPHRHTEASSRVSRDTPGSDGHRSGDASQVETPKSESLSDIYEENDHVCALSASVERRLTTAARLSAGSHDAALNMSYNACDRSKKEAHKPSISVSGNILRTGSATASILTETSHLSKEPNDWTVNVGSEFVCRRASNDLSVLTFTNLNQSRGMLGMKGWHWEVCMTYVDMMASICLTSGQSRIQKRALLGRHSSAADCLADRRTSSPMNSCGLVDLAFFQAPQNNENCDEKDTWSWRVRYAAIKALVSVYRSLSGDSARDGLRGAAWQAIIQAQRDEKHPVVIDALQLGEIKTCLTKLPSNMVVSTGAKLSVGLAAIYLPALPPPVDLHEPPKPHRSRTVTNQNRAKMQVPQRTTLREEIDLAMALYQRLPDYYTRTSFELRRVVEDQWRKELKANLNDEEEGRLEALKVAEEEEHLERRNVTMKPVAA